MAQGEDTAESAAGGVEVRTITLAVDCAHCGLPVPVNGPARELHCSRCLNRFPFHELGQALRSVAEGALTLGARFRVHAHSEWPACHACGAEVPVHEPKALVGQRTSVPCPGCQAGLPVFPAPDWLREQFPEVVQIFGGKPEAADLPDGAELPADPSALGPVAMACLKCGANLTITPETERTTSCGYCRTTLYIPDALWLKLHPVETMRKWSFGFRPAPKASWEEELARLVQEHDGSSRSDRRLREQLNAARRARKAEKRARKDAKRGMAERAPVRKLPAWLAVACVWLLLLGANALTWGTWMLTQTDLQTWAPVQALLANLSWALLAVGVPSGLSILVATYFAGRLLGDATGYDFDWVLFKTWFWLPFVLLFPVLGTLFALVLAPYLLVGRFAGATVTTNGNSTHYPAVRLSNREGWPAAFLFLALGLLWWGALIPVGILLDG